MQVTCLVIICSLPWVGFILTRTSDGTDTIVYGPVQELVIFRGLPGIRLRVKAHTKSPI